MQAILDKLDELAELRAAASLTRADYEQRRAEILRAVQAELEALEAEYAPLFETAAERQTALEAEIKALVAEGGQSVRHRGIQAVYARGRTTWDTKGLTAYAAEHPEVNQYRREGKPSVSLRVKDDA
jgi:Tfp pilus assembly protein PilO